MEQNRIHLVVNWIVDIVVMIVLACYTVYAFGGRAAVNGHFVFGMILPFG